MGFTKHIQALYGIEWDMYKKLFKDFMLISCWFHVFNDILVIIHVFYYRDCLRYLQGGAPFES